MLSSLVVHVIRSLKSIVDPTRLFVYVSISVISMLVRFAPRHTQNKRYDEAKRELVKCSSKTNTVDSIESRPTHLSNASILSQLNAWWRHWIFFTIPFHNFCWDVDREKKRRREKLVRQRCSNSSIDDGQWQILKNIEWNQNKTEQVRVWAPL